MAQNPATKFGTMRGKTPEEAKFFWTGGPVRGGGADLVRLAILRLHGVRDR